MMLSEIHFWSTKEEIIVKNTDYNSFKYYKNENADDILTNSKRTYCKGRELIWAPSNKRPFKLKEKLKELEEYLLQDKIVTISCEGDEVIILLSRGLLINILVKNNTDIVNITFNKHLLPKFQTDVICDGVISKHQIICLGSDGKILCCGGAWKDGWLIEVGLKRRVDLHEELLVVWGRTSSEHPQPWSPMGRDHQRANLLLYWVGARGPELLSYKKTEGEPFDVIISKVQQKSLIVIEQKVSQRGAVSVEVSTLDLAGNNLKRSCITSVPLQTQISCCSLSKNEIRLILGCIDGSVAMLDRTRGSTRLIKASFIPTFAAWHDLGVISMICNEKGQFQYFDTALNCIPGENNLPHTPINLSSYFVSQPAISAVKWSSRYLVIALDHGPLLAITHVEGSLSFPAVSRFYLNNNYVDKVIGLLLSWEWGDQCYFLLEKIVNYLLKLPMSEEISSQMQAALGCFHSPCAPLNIDVRHKFGSQVRALTRRFFHQLIRNKMFETAFLLAVDIGHHDLFMDLYYCAVKIGEREMAAAARAQASALLSRCSSENSCCSRSSCSQCSDSQSCSSDCSSSPEKELPVSYTSTFSQSFSDNYLSTNFNNANPRTYRPVPTCIDLPKIKSTYVGKAKSTNIPPLPITSTPKYFQTRAPQLPFAKNVLNPRSFPPTLCAADLESAKIPLPPFPVAPPIVPSTSHTLAPSTGKKQQAKVKFSDTVTAFIVPEIKRPVRPPPPPHLTDPQKELADSLPLCSPNEDYLKDFTPVKKNGDETPNQSKIKVVHFGVV